MNLFKDSLDHQKLTTIMSTEEAAKGPSKGELKKLAKKADKASSKELPSEVDEVKTKVASMEVITPKRKPAKLLLVNASTESLASIKVVWALQDRKSVV